jgi:integrase
MSRAIRRSKKRWKQDEPCLNRLLLPQFGFRLLTTTATRDIEQIHAAKGTDHSYAVNRFLEVVRKMLNWGRTTGKVPRDLPIPAVGIVPFPQTRRRRFVSIAGMPRLLKVVKAEEDEYAHHAMRPMLLTGLRPNELLRSNGKPNDLSTSRTELAFPRNSGPIQWPIMRPS